MTQFVILPENIEVIKIDAFLANFDEFLKRNLPKWDGDFSSCVTQIDSGFIDKYAEGFHELREIGTTGLSKKYIGRYYISIYSDIPHWVSDAIGDVTHGQLIEIKETEKENRGWRS
jgi:hypothetical protein